MEKKYIILTGSDGGFGNLGDEFILDGVKSFYKRLQKTHNIIILKHILPESKNDGYIYVLDYENDFSKLNIDIKDIALVHFYGGGYFNKWWMKDKVWLFHHLLKRGFSPDNIVFTGQGVGPLKGKLAEEARGISRVVSQFGTRDFMGAQYLDKSTFSYDDSVSLIRANRPRRFRYRTIAINLRPNAEYVEVGDKSLAYLLKTVAGFATDYHFKLKFFNMVQNFQYDEATEQQKIIKQAGLNGYVMSNRPKNHKILLKTVGASRLVITTSYHATLASLYAKVPVISLYDNKYYELKFEGLKECFDSALLHVRSMEKFNVNDIIQAIDSFTPKNVRETNARIQELKAINKSFYDTIESKLRS